MGEGWPAMKSPQCMRHTALSDGYVPMLVAVHQFQYQDQITVLMKGAFQEAPIVQVSEVPEAQERILPDAVESHHHLRPPPSALNHQRHSLHQAIGALL